MNDEKIKAIRPDGNSIITTIQEEKELLNSGRENIEDYIENTDYEDLNGNSIEVVLT